MTELGYAGFSAGSVPVDDGELIDVYQQAMNATAATLKWVLLSFTTSFHEQYVTRQVGQVRPSTTARSILRKEAPTASRRTSFGVRPLARARKATEVKRHGGQELSMFTNYMEKEKEHTLCELMNLRPLLWGCRDPMKSVKEKALATSTQRSLQEW